MLNLHNQQHINASQLAFNYAETKDQDIKNFSVSLRQAVGKDPETNSSLGISFNWITKSPYITKYSFG